MSDAIKDTIKKLNEINKAISSLDPAIRTEAFSILKPLYFDAAPKPKAADESESESTVETLHDTGNFFEKYNHEKPSDNVLLIAAWLYSQYGIFPLTGLRIEQIANKTGLTVPERPDNTMRYAQKNSKNLFRQQGRGWQLTVHGETYLKKNYEVKKGKLPLPMDDVE